MLKSIPLATAVALLFSPAAMAAIAATSTTDLNLRSGPDPSYPVITVMNAGTPVTIQGCIIGSRWCMVDFAGTQGWAFSQYLETSFGGMQVNVGVNTVALGLSTMTLPAQIAVAAAPTVVAPAPTPGTLGGSANVAISSTVSGFITAPATPPAFVRSFVISRPVTSAFVPGNLAIGMTLPPTINVLPVPQYQLAYAYVNGLPVLVDPATRQVVYIVT